MNSQLQNLVGQCLRYWFSDTEIIENYRPDWLFGMELDFYIPRYQIAIEAQGWQHYLFVPALHKTLDEYYAQRRRDERKRAISGAHNIQVVCFENPKGIYRKLRNTIKNHCVKHGLGHHTISYLPEAIKKEWADYHRNVSKSKRGDWIGIKVKRDGFLVGVNARSAQYIKEIYPERCTKRNRSTGARFERKDH